MHAYLLPCLDFGPAVVDRLIRSIPVSKYDKAAGEGRFTPREIAAHLADWEPIMRDRIKTAVDSPGVAIAAYDEEQMAIDHGYASSDIRQQCDLFITERRKTTAYVKSLTPDLLQQAVTHPERGRQTVEDLAGMLLGHDMYHIEQLSSLLSGT